MSWVLERCRYGPNFWSSIAVEGPVSLEMGMCWETAGGLATLSCYLTQLFLVFRSAALGRGVRDGGSCEWVRERGHG